MLPKPLDQAQTVVLKIFAQALPHIGLSQPAQVAPLLTDGLKLFNLI